MTAALSPHADLVGAILSRKYPLKRLVGAGGMGAVYETESADDGRRLAVKVLSDEFVSEPAVRERFLDEGRLCQRLVHPNIVRVFDVSEAEDGTPYIVMEYLDGVPLGAYTRSGVRVPMAQAASILQGVLGGLGAAHALGIVHRDLKPDNVVLARELNGAFLAKIVDFGIAKVMDAAGGMGSKTRTGALLGTPAYMSPEQIQNAKDVDARTDLWSAGVMFYEMVTGRVAFPAPTEYARLSAVLNTSPPPLEAVDPSLARLSAFVQLAMQKDRDGRFQSAIEMARALSAAAGADATLSSAIPMSRLPEVASVWLPVNHGSPAAQSGIAPLGTPRFPTPVPDSPPAATGPGGTLASSGSRPASDRAVHVVAQGAVQGTLPSENLPILAPHLAVQAVGVAESGRRGVAPWVVAVLVVGGIVVGFLGGLATRIGGGR